MRRVRGGLTRIRSPASGLMSSVFYSKDVGSSESHDGEPHDVVNDNVFKESERVSIKVYVAT